VEQSGCTDKSSPARSIEQYEVKVFVHIFDQICEISKTKKSGFFNHVEFCFTMAGIKLTILLFLHS